MAGEDELLEKNYVVPTTGSANQVVPPIDQDHGHDSSDSDSDSDSHPEPTFESTTVSKEVGLQHNVVTTTVTDTEAVDLERSGTRASSTVEYSVFSPGMKRYIVIATSCAGFFSPLSSQIYFPAMNTLAKDLNVSISLINLTMTSYMVRSPSLPLLDFDPIAYKVDLPRNRTGLHWRFRRQRRPTTGILHLLYNLPRRQRRSCATRQLCSSLRTTMHAECRE